MSDLEFSIGHSLATIAFMGIAWFSGRLTGYARGHEDGKRQGRIQGYSRAIGERDAQR